MLSNTKHLRRAMEPSHAAAVNGETTEQTGSTGFAGFSESTVQGNDKIDCEMLDGFNRTFETKDLSKDSCKRKRRLPDTFENPDESGSNGRKFSSTFPGAEEEEAEEEDDDGDGFPFPDQQKNGDATIQWNDVRTAKVTSLYALLWTIQKQQLQQLQLLQQLQQQLMSGIFPSVSFVQHPGWLPCAGFAPEKSLASGGGNSSKEEEEEEDAKGVTEERTKCKYRSAEQRHSRKTKVLSSLSCRDKQATKWKEENRKQVHFSNSS